MKKGLIALIICIQIVSCAFVMNTYGFNATIASYIAGFWFAIGIGHIFINFTVFYMQKQAGGKPRENTWLTSIYGWLERSIYFFAIIENQEEFIPFWLAFKTAIHWKRLYSHNTEENTNSKIDLYVLLIGSALSLFYSYVGAKMFEWGNRWYPHAIVYYISTPSLLVIGNMIIWGFIYINTKKEK